MTNQAVDTDGGFQAETNAIREELREKVSGMFKEHDSEGDEGGGAAPDPTPEDKPAEKPLSNPVLPDDIDKLFEQEKEPEKKEDEPEKKEELKDEKPAEDGKQDDEIPHEPKRLRAELKRMRQELAEARAKAPKPDVIEKAKAADEQAGKVVELEKQLAEFRKKVAAVDFTQSEEFQRDYAQPYGKALEKLATVAKPFKDVDGKQIEPKQLLNWVNNLEEDAPTVEAEIEEKFGYKPATLMQYLTKAADAKTNYTEGYGKAAELADQYRQNNTKAKEVETTNAMRRTAAQRELYGKLAETHANQTSVSFGFDPEETKSQAEVAKALDAAMESAEDEPSQLIALAKLRNYAAAAPVLSKRLKAAKAENAKLKKMLEEYEDTSPTTSGEGEESSEDTKRSFMRVIQR